MQDEGQLGHKPPAVTNPAVFTPSSNPNCSLTPTLGPAERTGSDQGTQQNLRATRTRSFRVRLSPKAKQTL